MLKAARLTCDLQITLSENRKRKAVGVCTASVYESSKITSCSFMTFII